MGVLSRNSYHRMLCCSAAVVCVAVATPAMAQTRTFDIPAQDASKGIPAFAKQAGIQLLASARDTRGKRTNAVRGNYSVAEALTILLRGTELEPVGNTGGPGIVTIRRRASAAAVSSVGDASENGRQPSEIVVTGTRIAQNKDQETVPVSSYTRAAIEKTGKDSITGFLNTLPEVSLATGQTASQNFLGMGGVRLRGLPVGTTLVLLNGRPLPSNGIALGSLDYFNLNNIPAAAVDTIDVVAQGSSAIYGSDALAGVVNIITRRRDTTPTIAFSYGGADRYDQINTSISLGHNFSRGSISAFANFQKSSDLVGSERSLTADNDYRRFGGTDGRSSSCSPGNVTASSGLLTGLTTSTAGIPDGISGRPNVSDFVATAGVANRCSNSQFQSLRPYSRSISGMISGEYKLGDTITAFSDFIYSNVYTETKGGFLTASLSVPVTNAFNPFGKTITVTRLFESLPLNSNLTSTFLQGLVGLKGTIGGQWKWEFAGYYSRAVATDRKIHQGRNVSALSTALASADPTTALNPFAAQSASNTLLNTIFYSPDYEGVSTNKGGDGFVSGTLFTLPGGPVSVVGGGSILREEFLTQQLDIPFSLGAGRTTTAGFGELQLPVIKGHNGVAAVLANGAIRYDHTSDFGGKVTYQLGLKLQPTPSLILRGAYSEAFKAPGIGVLYRAATTGPLNIADPRRSGETYSVTQTTGGNPNLQPETGRSTSFGFVWSPPWAIHPVLRASRWSVEEDNRVATLTPSILISNEAMFPDRVIRGAPGAGESVGRITSVQANTVNFGKLSASGIDVDLSMIFKLGHGILRPSATLSQTTRFMSALLPGVAPTDVLGKANAAGFAPRTKFRIALDYDSKPISMSASGRYTGKYIDYDGIHELGNFWYVDLNTSIDLSNHFSGISSRLHPALTINIQNLLDKLPDYSRLVGVVPFDPTQYDPTGRLMTIGFSIKL